MSGKLNMLGRRPATEVHYIAVFFIVTVAVLVVTAFAGVPYLQAQMLGNLGEKGTINGEVMAVHHDPYDVGTVTLRSSQIGESPNNTLNIFANKDTTVRICESSEPFTSLAANRDASIEYHEVGGVALADRIIEKC